MDPMVWSLVALKTCNTAMQEADRAAMIASFSGLVMPGAIREMVRISRLDPMIGFVNLQEPSLPLWLLLPIRTRPIDGQHFFADRVFGSEVVHGSAAHRRHPVVIND